MTEKISIEKIKENPENPRVIKDHKFKLLVDSIRQFPEMLELRPIVVNKDNVVLGGNMRLKACQAVKLKEVPIIRADELSPEKQREFIIKDNVGFGEWDWDALANEWDDELIQKWGLDVPKDFDQIKETKDIPDVGEVEFSEEMLLEHNYIVLYFDNPLDWEVAKNTYGLKTVKSKESSKGSQKLGIGRVLNGKNFI